MIRLKSILFNTEMVMAILKGRKTVTRRKIKLDLGMADTDKNDSIYVIIPNTDGDYHKAEDYCKYQVGDILYVRETFNDEETDTVLYAADKEFIDRGCKRVDNYLFMESEIKWKPSIHMPKKLARIFLKVTDIKIERVQDITIEDIEREGIYCELPYTKKHYAYEPGMRIYWMRLWNEIYGDWKENPFVYVIEFERVAS